MRRERLSNDGIVYLRGIKAIACYEAVWKLDLLLSADYSF
jgi:hypothetical protein